ncbi:MAG TPA: hypothetical protein VGG02_14525 [Chthoniobacterales bacterium]|jgi:phage terminase Nu1 subunit (DNA packaging protein)
MAAKTISLRHLAKLLDVTPRQVQLLTSSGVLHRATNEKGNELRGKYTLLSVRDYCRYLRTQSTAEDASETEHSALRNRRITATAEMSELLLNQYKSRLHEADDVEFCLTNFITHIKQRVLAIPSRAARLLPGKKFKEIYDLLSEEIATCLQELSGYDPSIFAGQTAAYLRAKGVEGE